MKLEHVRARTPGVGTLSYLSGDYVGVQDKPAVIALVKSGIVGLVIGYLAKKVFKAKYDTSVTLGFSAAGSMLTFYATQNVFSLADKFQ